MPKFSKLNKLLDNGRLIEPEKVPSDLKNTAFLGEEFVSPTRCPQCSGKARVVSEPEDKDGYFKTKCGNRHIEKIDAEERLRFSINFEEWFSKIGDSLEASISDVDDTSLPKYAKASTNSNFGIVLVVSSHDYRNSIRRIIEEAIEENEAILLLTPRSEIREIYDAFEKYSVGSMVCPYPFENLDSPKAVVEIIRNAVKFSESLDKIKDRRGWEKDEYLLKSSRNPMLIASELNYMEILRKNNELSRGEEERLEKVVKAAFSHIGAAKTNRGGDQDSGKNLPDGVARLKKTERSKIGPTLCLIDTKSGKNASFSKELADRKHGDYLKRANEQPVFENHHLSHIFVVFDIDGQQEFKFFDDMKENYGEQDYMIVMYSQALAMIMEIYNSNVLKNEIKLSIESFREFALPFLNGKAFYDRTSRSLREATRYDSKDVKEEKLENYSNKYRDRKHLIVVTPEMVKKRFLDITEDNSKVERILDSYFQ